MAEEQKPVEVPQEEPVGMWSLATNREPTRRLDLS